MKLSKRLRKWRKNITTQTLLDYVLVLHEDIMDFADEVKALEMENAKLRELANAMLQYIDPASHQDTCGIECPAHSICKGKSMCSFPDWAVREAEKFEIEVE